MKTRPTLTNTRNRDTRILIVICIVLDIAILTLGLLYR